MGRTLSFGSYQMRVKPRPLVGTKTFIRQKQRDMRDQEWSDSIGGPIVEALRDNAKDRAWDEVLNPPTKPPQ